MTSQNQDTIRAELDAHKTYFESKPDAALSPCDLIMQGGVASGVVYPAAILQIAREHSLHGVGGTSAGAIGAAVAAAAEYGRRNGARGYAQFVDLSEDILDKGIGRLFQPSFLLRGPFNFLVATQSRDPIAGVVAYIAARWPYFLLSGIVGLASSAWLASGSPAVLARGVVTPATAALSALTMSVIAGTLFGIFKLGLRLFGAKAGFWNTALNALLLVTGAIGAGAATTAIVQMLHAWWTAPTPRPAVFSRDLLEPEILHSLAAASTVLAGLAVAGLVLWMFNVLLSRRRPWLEALQIAALAIGLGLAAFAFFWFRDDRLGKLGDAKFWIDVLLALASEVPALIAMGFILVIADLMIVRQAKHNFGLCSGVSPGWRNSPALMDWLHDHIQKASGKPFEQPLTFGDLEPERKRTGVIDTERDIRLRMTVTDLGLRRPHTLPLLPDRLGFVPRELARVLPKAVVAAMYDGTSADKWHPLPPWHGLPVLFAVRMSLCYPVLFRMVPLYQKADPDALPETPQYAAPAGLSRIFRKRDTSARPRRVLFTDGGICTNFPIHFYDGLLPRWPTLAIALDASADPENGSVDIDRTDTAPRPQDAPLSLVDALGRIIQTAGGWRDQVQTSLPGYRERVCVVGLTRKQGGFNFDMARADVAGAMLLGRDAGRMLCGEVVNGKPGFDLQEHRYRRFLVAYARLEETLDLLARTWRLPGLDWPAFVRGYRSPEFPQNGAKAAAIDRVVTVVDSLAGALIAPAPPLREQYDVPHPPTNLRVTPRE